MKELVKFGKRIVGWINPEKKIYSSKRTIDHQFHKYGEGFGLSVTILNMLQERDIRLIHIIFNGKVYQTTIRCFFEYGIGHKNEVFPYDNQLILPFKNFDEIRESEVQDMLDA